MDNVILEAATAGQINFEEPILTESKIEDSNTKTIVHQDETQLEDTETDTVVASTEAASVQGVKLDNDF